MGRYSHSVRETGPEIVRQHTEFTQWTGDQVFRENKMEGAANEHSYVREAKHAYNAIHRIKEN